MPQMGVSVSEGTITEWLKQVGDEVAYEEPICVISTDKIDTELPSPAAGTLSEILVDVGQTVDVGTPLARIGGEAVEAPAPPQQSNGHAKRYSPVVSRIAAEHGIDLDKVEGTGRGGRVRKQDVLACVGGRPPLHIESPYRPDPAPTVASTEGLSRMRRQIGAHMKRSLEVAATCTTWIEVDFGRIEAARRRLGITALP